MSSIIFIVPKNAALISRVAPIAEKTGIEGGPARVASRMITLFIVIFGRSGPILEK